LGFLVGVWRLTCLNRLPHFTFLVWLGIVSGIPGEGCPSSGWVQIVSMTAAPATVDESSAAEITHQFANFTGQNSVAFC